MPRCSKTRRALAAFLACCTLSANGPAAAQEPYPSRTITWVVGYPPGGSVDVVTRLIARKLERSLGQSIVVDNRPGASGAIALRYVAGLPADGYTLATVPGPVLTNIPMPQLGKELAPVAMLAKGATVLVGTAQPGAPKDLKALLADASAHPDKYSFASSGNGTGQHLAGELINIMAGTRMTHVPYKGGSQAVTDVVGGQIPLAVLGITPVLPHVKSGKLIAYGVSSAKRSSSLPEVPTLHEAGLAGFEADQWFVLAARQGLAAGQAARLNAAVAEALRDPEVVSSYEKLGLFPDPASPEQTAVYVRADLKRWSDLVRKAKLSLD
jgi:tripartite-type tricarboxylate transporter receptor subunit TctC